MALPLEPLPALSVIVLLGAVAQWVGWRLRLPSILPLLAVGFLIGPVSGIVDVDAVFGPLLRPFVSLAVAMILFEGGLTLRLSELAGSGGVVRNLVTIGAGITWVCISAAAHWIAGVPFDLALLIGAILVLTGPTVIVPLVRHIRPTGPVGPILRWEGILIDPLGALLALLVFEAVSAGRESSVAHVVTAVLGTLCIGGAIGTLAALLLGRAIAHHWLSDRLQVPAALATVAAVFAGANALQQESGLVGVTMLGIVLANMRAVDMHRIAEFKEDLGTVLLALLFIVLSARLPLAELTGLGWQHALVVAVAVFLVRPLAVLASTHRSELGWRHRAFLMAMAPRGIVAAAVGSEFALQLEVAGRSDAGAVSSLVFACIVGTVSFYGLLSPRIARWLGLAEAEPRGVLFAGAGHAARVMAAALARLGVPTLLVDTNAVNVQLAQDAGLRAWHGSILSQRFLDEVDLAGIGRLCAMTGSDEVNLLAVRQFRGIFEGRALYQLATRTSGNGRFGVAVRGHGRWLFRADATAGQLQAWMARGAVVEVTRVADRHDLELRGKLGSGRALPLFAVHADGSVVLATVDVPLQPRPGSTIVALVAPETGAEAAAPAALDSTAPASP
ncbi:MAG TPA: sodium:proton antiporter [Vicinamibacterales bacterium]|nr:sodium:proton antiporter [Vicinamibacterales bacterium]